MFSPEADGLWRAAEASQGWLWPGEAAALFTGRKGAAPPGAAVMVTASTVDGRALFERHLPLTTGKGRLDLPPVDAPAVLSLALDLPGGALDGALWLRIDPVGNAVAPTAVAPPPTPAQAAWFDADWYRRMSMQPAGRDGDPWADYAARAGREPVRPHPLFDAEWYVRRHALPDGVAPLDDFLARGDRAPSATAEATGRWRRAAPDAWVHREPVRAERVSWPSSRPVQRDGPPPDASDLSVAVVARVADAAEAERVDAEAAGQSHAPSVVVRVDRASGAAGLNAALDGITADVVAFWDGASTWAPDHLARLAATLDGGSGAAFASWKRVEPDGRERWLGQPFDARLIAWQDPIPLSTLAHRRGPARFDAAAGAAMDWAYLNALTGAGEPAWSPHVTVERRQIADPGREDRFARVRDRLDWSAPSEPASGASVILVAHGRATRTLETLAALARDPDAAVEEVLVMDAGVSERDLPLLDQAVASIPGGRLVTAPHPVRAALGADLAAMAARGNRLVFVTPGAIPAPGWISPLLGALDAGASAAWPTLRHPDGGEAGEAMEAALAVRAGDFRRVRGFDPRLDGGPAGADLGLRLASATGRGGQAVAASTVVRAGLPALSWSPVERAARLFADRHGVTRGSERDAPRASIPDGPLRIGLKVCFANEPTDNSGDLHFARSLAAALEAEGCRCRIDGALDWYASPQADDVVLALRGRWRYRPSPRHLNLMWLISHPDEVTGAELAGWDHVFSASDSLPEALAARARDAGLAPPPITSLLQCTDPTLFHPPTTPTAPDGIVFVANSRGVEREMAARAVAERLPVEIHGRQWDRFDARALVRSPGLPNAGVANLYRRAVVLNDHWDDMRRAGIVSNRLFDAAACAAPMISDPVEGLDTLFDGLLAVHRSGAPLAPILSGVMAREAETRDARLALARTVMARHSFAARAAEIVSVARAALAARAAEPNRVPRA